MPTIRLPHPHPDLELGIPRAPLHYNVAYPQAGVDDDTGLIFYIHGFGQRYNESYSEKLLPFLSDKYNCLAVSVDYHGAIAHNGFSFKPAPDIFLRLKEHYGVTVTADADIDVTKIILNVYKALASRGIKTIHQSCLMIKDESGYINFGLLPALDHFQVVSHIIRNNNINKKRIYVIGTSYGGYVATLMSKIAPRTFRFIVDNSGFSGPADMINGIYGYTGGGNEDLGFFMYCPYSFSMDKNSKNYFTAERRLARDLPVAGHYNIPSNTVIYSYHSAADCIAPTKNKINVTNFFKSISRRHDLQIITSADIDGSLFKDSAHGMSASMRGLFDLSYNKWIDSGAPDTASNTTDFDMRTVNLLECGTLDYEFTFGENGATLSIKKH